MVVYNISNSSDSGSLFQPIPWTMYEVGSTRFWVHYGLVIACFVLAVITTIAQKVTPAPYGKHDRQDANWGPRIPQRIGHVVSDAIPGIVMFILVFFLYGSERGPVNIVLLILFEAHYIQRGAIHPLAMRYGKATVPIGITLGGLFPNFLYHFINADFIGNAKYSDSYLYDPRFILGVLLYIIGYVINRWADWKLRKLRQPKGENKGNKGYSSYSIPYGGLFEVVSCPNYFGEFIEWFGWALATWSLAGVVWWLFGAATFFPRAGHNHQWYKKQFENYPPKRRALIPYIY